MFSNFIELAGQYLTPEITTNISKFVGESPGNTQKALGLAVPSLMGAACNHVSKSEGAGSLLDWVSPAKLDYSTVLSNFGNPLRGGMPLEDVLKKGEGLISPLLRKPGSGGCGCDRQSFRHIGGVGVPQS